MKLVFSLALLLTASLSFGQLKIDAKNAQIKFEFLSDGTKGTVSGFEAEVNINLKDLSSSKVTGKVDANTLDTGNKMRDGHLKKSFFKVKDHPEMSFSSGKITQEGTGYKMTGTFTIGGVSQNEVVMFEVKDGKILGKTTIDSHRYEVSPKKAGKSDVKIEFIIPIVE